MTTQTAFKKSDDELRIVWGEVYVPDLPDAHNDIISREEVMKMAYVWMAKGDVRCIDIEHNGEIVNAVVVESFVARAGDPDFIEGAWVAGVHIPDDDIWDMVKKGEINGFSMQGRAIIGETLEVEMPGDVTGVTKSHDGHEHTFVVAYDDDGRFIGGVTNEVDGHHHLISKGTLTDEAAGHTHRFDLMRGVIGSVGT